MAPEPSIPPRAPSPQIEALLPHPRPWRFWRLFWRFWWRLLYRMEVQGRENIPRDGGVLLAPNHIAYIDPFVVNIAQDRPLCFMTWDAVFKIPLLSGIIRYLGAFPVSLEHVDRRALRIARALLQRGEVLVIFPEGGRTFDGHLTELRPGVVRLALQTGAPIVPVRIEGMYRVWPRQQLLPWPFGKLRIAFGPPIPAPAHGEKQTEEAETLATLKRIETFLAAAGPGAPAALPPPQG